MSPWRFRTARPRCAGASPSRSRPCASPSNSMPATPRRPCNRPRRVCNRSVSKWNRAFPTVSECLPRLRSVPPGGRTRRSPILRPSRRKGRPIRTWTWGFPWPTRTTACCAPSPAPRAAACTRRAAAAAGSIASPTSTTRAPDRSAPLSRPRANASSSSTWPARST